MTADAPRSAAPERRDRSLPLIVFAGRLLIRLLARSWRLRTEGFEGVDRLIGEGRGMVLALWHGEMLGPLIAMRGRPVAILISSHRDGEIIARIAAGFGYASVRGSSSRGGGRALLEIVRRLQAGGIVAVTPDGPRGPRHSFAGGTVVAAQRAEVPVIALRMEVSSAWTLRSWDRFTIPKPFARVVVRASAPTLVEATTMADSEREVARFQQLMADTGPDTVDPVVA